MPVATRRCQSNVDRRFQSDKYVPLRYCSTNRHKADRVRSNPLTNRDCEHVYGSLRFVIEREPIAAWACLNEAFAKQIGMTRHRQRYTTESLARQTSDQAPFAIAHQNIQFDKAGDFTGSRCLQGQR